MRMGFVTILLLCFCARTYAYTDSSTLGLIKEGLYIENLKVLIPWNLNYYDALNYGNARTIKRGSRGVDVAWDSATVFGMRLNLRAPFLEKFLSTEIIGSVYQIQAPIELKDTQTLKTYLLNAIGNTAYVTETKKFRDIVWAIDEYFVQINIYKYGTAKAVLRFGRKTKGFDRYYLKKK